ncbi:acetylglutamate kinase [Oceanobacillus halophilus]|uniref:Acetylglutamate kinase n=1 Tax=Oceanobacillus halophilus TaxID=930130 RepID=A0A495A3Q5_9BACI|nr:acetylglutamate kinase [Oceanobacillus halophilus]RKQ33856.1 acetylglutamate kinase [Oceanobacillus halophilus]
MNTIILKMGGSILEKLPISFYQKVAELRKSGICQPIIVHGGGPEINLALKQSNVETTFVDGLRVTTEEVLNVAEMVMSGSINKRIVAKINKSNGKAFGLSGVDGSLLHAEPVDQSGKLGFVGQVAKVNDTWLKLIIEKGGIPVISPIGIDSKGTRYNINGDMAAAAVASAMKGKLIFVSDIPGVMETINGKQVVHSKLSKHKIESMITSGVIYGGMIPKVRSAINALSGGVSESVIIDGLTPTNLEGYLNGQMIGTKIVMGELQHV